MATSLKNDEAFQREMDAQRKRVQARAYLEKHGVGPGEFEAALNAKGDNGGLAERKNIKSTSTDNTLDLLLKKSAVEAENSRSAELQSKASLLEQQRNLRERVNQAPPVAESKTAAADELPAGWKVVIDKATGKPYYWNKSNNVTSWTRPQLESSALTAAPIGAHSNLPEGWTQLVHPATNQIYYKHLSGKTSSTRPQDGIEKIEKNVPAVPEPVRLNIDVAFAMALI
jgi:hypothetical protein